MAQRKPAEVFPPAQFIREELHARGWTQKKLAKRSGWPLFQVACLCSGDMSIRRDAAVMLAKAFDTDAIYWLNLEAAWQEWKGANRDE